MAKNNHKTTMKLVPAKRKEEKEPVAVPKEIIDENKKEQVKKKQVLKSNSKAAGVKSVFGVDDRIIMTSFGKGNDAVIEKLVENGTVKSVNTPESYSVEPEKEEKKFKVRGAMEIRARGERTGRRISASPDYPRCLKGTLGLDQIGAKNALEMRYFGKTFNDNIHIQVIYNILDIEKVLAVMLNNIVYSINNLSRDTADEKKPNDFLGLGSSVRLDKTYEAISRNPENKAYKEFKSYYDNPRLNYFSNAFFRKTTYDEKIDTGNNFLDDHPEVEQKWLADHPNKAMMNKDIAKFGKQFIERDEKTVYGIFALLDELRQTCVHDCEKGKIHGHNSLGRAAVFNLGRDGYVDKGVLDILDLLYSERIHELSDFAHNSAKCNFRVIFDALNITGDAEKQTIAKEYYNYAVLKNYKNLGFSIKLLREQLMASYMPDLKEKKFDSIRSKVYGIIDFLLVKKYNEDQNGLSRLVAELRASVINSEKEGIYSAEAERVWKKEAPMLKAVVAKLSLITTGSNEIRNYKLTKEEEKLVKEAVEEVAIKGKASNFSELIFMLTLLIDGKEINDLLTSLINKLDNIASLLNTIRREKLEERFVDEYAFFNRDRYFDNNGRCTVLEELRCINGFAKMSGETDSAKKVMYEDAVLLLGIEGHDEKDLEVYVDSFLDKTKMRVRDNGKPDTGFRNFIASNVIESRRFKYIVRFMNPAAARNMIKNKQLVRFVLEKIPETQIDRYCVSCGYDGADKIEYLTRQVMGVQADLFTDVDQSANAERNRKKQRYVTVLSLYLNVLYRITKNLVNINSRYAIAFHNLERDGMLLLDNKVSHNEHNQKMLAEKIVADRRKSLDDIVEDLPKEKKYYKQFMHEDRVIRYCEQDLLNSDEVIIEEFRNSVSHLSAVRKASLYIDKATKIESYFCLYHFIMQKSIAASYDYAKAEGNIFEEDGVTKYKATNDGKVILEFCPKSLEYIREIKKRTSYCKDFVKAYCAPFIYNLARFKNLSIDILFDRNEERERTKKNTAIDTEDDDV